MKRCTCPNLRFRPLALHRPTWRARLAPFSASVLSVPMVMVIDPLSPIVHQNHRCSHQYDRPSPLFPKLALFRHNRRPHEDSLTTAFTPLRLDRSHPQFLALSQRQTSNSVTLPQGRRPTGHPRLGRLSRRPYPCNRLILLSCSDGRSLGRARRTRTQRTRAATVGCRDLDPSQV